METENSTEKNENSVKDFTVKTADKLGIAPKKFFLAALAAVVAIVVAIVIIVIACSGSTPTKTAVAYSKALLSGNVAEANLLSLSDLHETNKAKIKIFAESSKDAHKFSRLAFIEFAEDLKKGKVVEEGDFALIYNDNGMPIAQLKKIGDTWKCVKLNFAM